MIFEYLKKFKYASRKGIDLLVVGKLSDVLSNKQKSWQHPYKNEEKGDDCKWEK